VFHYKARQLEPENFPFVDHTPRSLPTKLAGFRSKPGISAFAGFNETDGISGSLKPLLQASADALHLHDPKVDLSQVPVYLGATAGMRTLSEEDRDRAMAAVRKFFRSSDNPFAFAYDEQARVIAGEEEGAFGWLALNKHHAFSADSEGTFGAIDVGGGSAQITFIPRATSVLAGIFPMHFAGDKGPIHLYTHSFLRFGHTEAFKRATEILAQSVGNGSEALVEHPCLPHGLSWKVTPGEWGTSTDTEAAERRRGPVELRGTGNFSACRAFAKQLFPQTNDTCFLPPCSMFGVYQPELKDSRFVILGKAAVFREWEVSVLVEKGVPLLQALEKQMHRICSLPLNTSVELFGRIGLLAPHGEPPCWLGTWLLTLLSDGFQFPSDSQNIKTVRDCCDGVDGHAIYEVNFFPYQLKKTVALVTLSAARNRTAVDQLPGMAILLVAAGGVLGAAFTRALALMRNAAARCNRCLSWDAGIPPRHPLLA